MLFARRRTHCCSRLGSCQPILGSLSYSLAQRTVANWVDIDTCVCGVCVSVPSHAIEWEIIACYGLCVRNGRIWPQWATGQSGFASLRSPNQSLPATNAISSIWPAHIKMAACERQRKLNLAPDSVAFEAILSEPTQSAPTNASLRRTRRMRARMRVRMSVRMRVRMRGRERETF